MRHPVFDVIGGPVVGHQRDRRGLNDRAVLRMHARHPGVDTVRERSLGEDEQCLQGGVNEDIACRGIPVPCLDSTGRGRPRVPLLGEDERRFDCGWLRHGVGVGKGDYSPLATVLLMHPSDASTPSELQRVVQRELDGIALRDLRAAADRLTAAYRSRGAAAPRGRSSDFVDRLAYLAARMPATYAATRAVLGELRRRQPGFDPTSVLDLGAGPATALWAASTEFASLVRATHVETDRAMAELGQRLLEATALGRRVHSTWHAADVARLGDLPRHDLVLVGYVLGELVPAARAATVDAAWHAAAGALAIVEPGSPAGTSRILDARARLLDQGAALVAPCPHAAPCPLGAGDWCHFGVRLNRSSLHRRLKRAVLAYEDEKYAYVIVVREPAAPASGRIIRRPDRRAGRVLLRVCAPSGVSVRAITRKDAARYRLARQRRWGDAWEE